MRRWEAAGAITYLGALDDVRPALGEADAMVLPTFYPEGTPRSLLEAAAMGKPLITTDVPGCRDVLDEGVNGFLCEPKSIQSLADAMLRMIELSEEQLRSMGAASRRKAETRFDEQIVITRYLDAVRDALDSAS
jgi:glycosyltransferase involved in cell wall biosynthesis